MEKLKIRVPHQELNDRLPLAYRDEYLRQRSGDRWLVAMFVLVVLFWIIAYVLWRIFH